MRRATVLETCLASCEKPAAGSDAAAAARLPQEWFFVLSADGRSVTQSGTAATALLPRADASVLVIATPVYKAAYSGVLKVFLDLLPQTALKGKVVLPLATGGSPHHMLALDYALRPVLQSLGAKHILPGVYASDSQIPKDEDGSYRIGDEIQDRLDDAVHILLHEGLRLPVKPGFEPVAFASVQYSV